MNFDLRRLQILEAVYRHRSIGGAAAELEISSSAVSHQIRKLSEEIGEQLIAKSGRGILLTEVGKRLAESLNSAFAQIERSVGASVGRENRMLRLAVCSSFGPGWLIERLPDFRRRHPEIDLQLRMYARDPQLSDSVADAFVTAYPLDKGFWSMPLIVENLVPVLAPDVEADDLPLITTDIDPAQLADDWKDYETSSGRQMPQLRSGNLLQCTHYLFAMEMAVHGMGIALLPDFLAESRLRSRLLKKLDNTRFPSGRRYHLSIKAARTSERILSALSEWFSDQMDECRSDN